MTPSEELDRCIEAARGGDAASARRAAELYEVVAETFPDAYALAELWWFKAAELGDPDAVDYVAHILS